MWQVNRESEIVHVQCTLVSLLYYTNIQTRKIHNQPMM